MYLLVLLFRYKHMSSSLAIVSFFVSITLVIIIQKIFLHYKFIDQINNRSSHDVVATRSGGLAVFLVLFIISLICYVSENTIFDYSIIIPLSLLVLVGMYDDIYNVDFVYMSVDHDRSVNDSILKIHNELKDRYKLFFGNGGDQNNNSIPEKEICDKLSIELIDNLGNKIQSSSWLLKANNES